MIVLSVQSVLSLDLCTKIRPIFFFALRPSFGRTDRGVLLLPSPSSEPAQILKSAISLFCRGEQRTSHTRNIGIDGEEKKAQKASKGCFQGFERKKKIFGISDSRSRFSAPPAALCVCVCVDLAARALPASTSCQEFFASPLPLRLLVGS